MASSTRPCAIKKCEIFSCAVCHCCRADLCLDHLKLHKDELNAKLIPVANQINIFLDKLEHFNPDSAPSCIQVEQWRIAAHETIDRFCQQMQHELHERIKNKPLEKLHTTRNTLEQLIKKQGATNESIASLNNDIQSIEQEIESAQSTAMNLRPLLIDNDKIIQSDSSNKVRQPKQKNQASLPPSMTQDDLEALQNGTAFQIFVEISTERKIFVVVKPLDTIADLKHKIEARTSIPVRDQRLQFVGKSLENGFNIAAYDIQKHSSIQLTPGCRPQQPEEQSQQ